VPTIGVNTAASFMNLKAGRPRVFGGLREFSAFLKAEAVEEPLRLLAAAGVAGSIFKWKIQAEFGDDSKLAPNTPTTQDLRSDGGAGGPLLVSGALRDSIEAMAEPFGDGAIMGVGSASQILVWQEHGFTTAPDSMIPNKIVPPRPAFALGVYEAAPLVQQAIMRFVLPGTEWRNVNNTFGNFMNPESYMRGAGDIRAIGRGQMPYQRASDFKTGVFLG